MGDKIFQAIIESPKGDDRRRHFDKKKNKVIDLEPLKDVIPVNNGIAPINYGFIIGTKCQADNEEIDALVISENKLKIGEQVEIYPIALMLREDGDDKIVAVDNSTIKKFKTWQNIPKEKRNLIEKFFSYHHKFTEIKGSKDAVQYIEHHGIQN